MDLSTKIRLLRQLSNSRSELAVRASEKALKIAIGELGESGSYPALEYSLEALALVGGRNPKGSVDAVAILIASVGARTLSDFPEYEALGPLRYRNAHALILKAIDVLSVFRHLAPVEVASVALPLSRSKNSDVRRAVEKTLRSLFSYDYDAYTGKSSKSDFAIGAFPQLTLVEWMDGLPLAELVTCLDGTLVLLNGMLSTTMESSTWSSSSVTLTRAEVPADAKLEAIREKSISLLWELYKAVSSTNEKLKVVGALNNAARRYGNSADNESSKRLAELNAVRVLGFYKQIASESEMQLVQKIEHNSYWISFHTKSAEVRSAALEVKAEIDRNSEYEIYKTLVGFEGIFGKWDEGSHAANFERGSHDLRVQTALRFVDNINQENYDVWKRRIISFSQTESDDLATFPVFYEFMADLANRHPAYALELARVHASELATVLIPLLRGLWDGPKHEDVKGLIFEWASAENKGSQKLMATAKMFLSTKEVDAKTLSLLLAKARALHDKPLLRLIAAVAGTRAQTPASIIELKHIFLESLRALSVLGDARWLGQVWLRSELELLINSLSASERFVVFENLTWLTQIDYQAEDLLTSLARVSIAEVLVYLIARIYGPMPPEVNDSEDFEDIPYQFNSLHEELSKAPQLVIDAVQVAYNRDSSLFEYRGGKMISAIYPGLPEKLQSELIRVANASSDEGREFVVRILRSYGGEASLGEVAKELVRQLHYESPLLEDIEIALSATGVVSGLYGVAEAYEKKRSEILTWVGDSDGKVRDFAFKFATKLEAMRDAERARADESSILRKHAYGE